MDSLQGLFLNRSSEIFDSFLCFSREMGVSNKEISKIQINYELNSKKISPEIGYKKEIDRIILTVPLFFIIQLEDFKENDVCLKKIFKFLFKSSLTEKEEKIIKAFHVYLQNPKKVEDSKRFVLKHEAAHILHGDIYEGKCSSEKSIEREKRADMTACFFERSNAGALYLFQIMKEAGLNETNTTHPSFSERIEYISELIFEMSA